VSESNALRRATRRRAVLTFGVKEVDRRLPRVGWRSAPCMSGRGGNGAVDGRRRRCLPQELQRGRGPGAVVRHPQDLFAPALAQAGLAPDRSSMSRRPMRSRSWLLRGRIAARGLGAVVAEVARLSMTASRRFSLRRRLRLDRHRHTAGGVRRGCGLRSADGLCHALARQRAPSTPLLFPASDARVAGRVDPLSRGESADFELEACDAKGRLALPSDWSTDRVRRNLATPRLR